MPYVTFHHNIEVEYVLQRDGTVDIHIKPAFVAFSSPAKIGKVTVNGELFVPKEKATD